MRTFLNLLSTSTVLIAGAQLLPVLANDFDAREVADPLDLLHQVQLDSEPGPQQSSPKAGLRLDEVKDLTTLVRATLPATKVTVVPEVVRVMTGEASWYGPGFYGNRTANGEVFKPGTMTAAHRTLPFGTKVRVTNLWNGRSAVIRINDRGPFIDHRVIDLGHGAASSLGLISSGVAQVRLEVLR